MIITGFWAVFGLIHLEHETARVWRDMKLKPKKFFNLNIANDFYQIEDQKILPKRVPMYLRDLQLSYHDPNRLPSFRWGLTIVICF